MTGLEQAAPEKEKQPVEQLQVQEKPWEELQQQLLQVALQEQ